MKTPDQHPTPLPFSIQRRQLYILPTAHGFLFLVILSAMLLGSVNYNNNLGFLLVFLLGSITLVSILHTYRNVLGLTFLSISADPVFAGENGVFRFLIRSGPVVRHSIKLKIDHEFPATADIDQTADTVVDLEFHAAARGVFRPACLTVWSCYPLGLFKTWTVISLDFPSCIVYPSPLAGPMQLSQASGSNSLEPADAIQPGVDDFSGLRSYQAGDPMSRVSWKTLSRGLGIFTKEFTGYRSHSVMLEYDNVDATGTEEKLSRLCGMVIQAHNINMTYGLCLPGITISPGNGNPHKNQCLKTLAVFEMEKAENEAA